MSTVSDLNFHREVSAEYAIVFDSIQGGVSAEDETKITDGLYKWVDKLLARQPVSEPIRPGDYDQVTGSYFGAMLLALATEGSARSTAVLNNPVFLGSFDRRLDEMNNMRNAIKRYINTWSAGGVWVESSGYDLGTLQLALMGVEAVRTGTERAHFPEAAAFDRAGRARTDGAACPTSSKPRSGVVGDQPRQRADLQSLPDPRHGRGHAARGARPSRRWPCNT